MLHVLIRKLTHLENYPEKDSNVSIQAGDDPTIGDLHGNALKFLHALVRQGTVDIAQEDYQLIVTLYNKPTDILTADDIANFNAIINSIKINKQIPIRLIGDEVADRGSNDYFTLKILEKIVSEGTAVSILLSNHGLKFIYAYEVFKTFGSLSPLEPGKEDQSRSMHALQCLIDKGLISGTEVRKIIDTYYKRSLKALDYSLSRDQKTIIIYSHAPIGLNVIQDLAEFLGLEYNDKGAEDLAKTIDRINDVCQQAIDANRLCQRICAPLEDGRPRLIEVFLNLTFNRQYDHLTIPPELNDYALWFVHGHGVFPEAKAKRPENIFDLDDTLGKSYYDTQQKLISCHTGIGQYFIFSPISPYEKQILPSLDILERRLLEMKIYGNSLQLLDSNKSKAAVTLAEELCNNVKEFRTELQGKHNFKEAQLAFEKFNQNFKEKLHSQDLIMAKHRQAWKPIILNIAIALTVVGAFILAGKALYAWTTKQHGKFFFGQQTERQNKISRVKQTLDTAAASIAIVSY